ncbi:sensor histidine kinase [Actinoalloteichus caeruleus]|uniref:sensor histidine kinase n=1 Tax=Actinoalloteichus cyanogriseus TaxID=2893586 RepID=UPI000AC00781|nr:histidine kinase [Actinoalloteichus caeruleus]
MSDSASGDEPGSGREPVAAGPTHPGIRHGTGWPPEPAAEGTDGGWIAAPGRRTARGALAVDCLLGAAVTAVVAVAITADLGGSRGPDVTAYLFAAGLGALMVVRRPFPLLALAATATGVVAYHIADFPPIGLAIPLAAALFSAAEAGRARIAVVTSTVLLAVSSFFRLREGEDVGYLLGYELASSVGVMAAAIALGDAVRARRRWRWESRRRALSAAVEREREAESRVAAERLRIARDLHDVLGHTIAVVSLQADVAAEALADDPASARSALGAIRSASDDASRELRATLGLLRDPAEGDGRSPMPGLDQLGRVVTSVSDGGLTVRTRVEGTPRPLPLVVETTALRVVQEALTNVLRHADARHAEVVVRHEETAVWVEVGDDGRGPGGGHRDGAGQGLRGMCERVGLLGGSVELGRAPSGGFLVTARLPREVVA